MRSLVFDDLFAVLTNLPLRTDDLTPRQSSNPSRVEHQFLNRHKLTRPWDVDAYEKARRSEPF